MAEKKKSRHNIRRNLTRKQITFAAFFELATGDVDSVAIQKIMKRAGFAFNTFYIHYQDKGEMFQGIVSEVILPWKKEYEQQIGKQSGAVPHLALAIRYWVQEFLRDREFTGFVQRNSSHLLDTNVFEEYFALSENSPKSGIIETSSATLARSQLISLLTATSSLAIVNEATDDIDIVTAEAILTILQVPKKAISAAINKKLKPTKSLRETMRENLDGAVQESLRGTPYENIGL